MIPRVERRGISPTIRTAQARRAGPAQERLGSVNGTFTTLTASTSRCTGRPGAHRHTSLNTHTGTVDAAPERAAQPLRDPPQTPHGYHTPYNTSFLLSQQDARKQRATSISHQNKKNY